MLARLPGIEGVPGMTNFKYLPAKTQANFYVFITTHKITNIRHEEKLILRKVKVCTLAISQSHGYPTNNFGCSSRFLRVKLWRSPN